MSDNQSRGSSPTSPRNFSGGGGGGTTTAPPSGTSFPRIDVLGSPRGQPPGQYSGQRNDSDSDRLQRDSNFQKGVKPSLPTAVKHDAERKYDVGTITNGQQDKRRQLEGVLNKLTPQNFEKSLDQVKQVNIDNADTLSVVVLQIYEKASMEPTCVEMYANLCSRLSVELPNFSENNQKITFKRLLLDKCQQEFEREGEVEQTEDERVEARRRSSGNIRLIGELYKKKMLPEIIMHLCIMKLLEKNQTPDEENIEVLCKLMSTIGEMIDHRKYKKRMDLYFDMIFKLSNNMDLSSGVRFMLKDIIDLRHNKWRQRLKVEGPEKKCVVRREAAQERQAQANRVAREPTSNRWARRARKEFGPKGLNVLPSTPQMGGYPRLTQQFRAYGIPGSSLNTFENRPWSRARVTMPPQSSPLDKVMSEEQLHDMSIMMIKEYYSARDVKEVVLCIRDLNAPSFYPSMISIWVIDSFERKDVDRDSLTQLLINLAKSQDGILSQDSLVKGFESVLSTLEDAVNDAPKAAEFLGRIFAKVLLENVIPYAEVWRLIYEGGEEKGRLVELGLAAKVLGVILEIIISEKGIEDMPNNQSRSSNPTSPRNFPSGDGRGGTTTAPPSDTNSPRRGVNHGVLGSPNGQPPGQYSGQHNDSDSDRWQRDTNFQKCLKTSLPTPVMHKAERKYEVGKITDQEQAKQRQLKGILNKLTPQNFEKLFDQVIQVNIDNADTLFGAIGQIFNKALMEPTFVEMYASFCSRLSVELPDFSENNEKITFKRILLNKCQEEFERGEREEEEANRDEDEGEVKPTEEEREEKRVEARRRRLGNFRLLGELYKKRMLTERIMHECIKKLLGMIQTPDPDEENIEALCKLMSTVGKMIDHPKAKIHMDVYFDIMFKLSNNMDFSSQVRFMLKDVIDLRNNKWQQRMKVEVPEKKCVVRREAAQERQVQANRVSREPNSNRWARRSQMEFGPKWSNVLPSTPQMGGYRRLTQQFRAYGNPGPSLNTFENRPWSRARVTTPPQSGPLDKVMSEEQLHGMSIMMIKEFYSARDVKEVVLCIRDLNAPSFYTSMISIWVIDSFERKDMDRDSLTQLLINLAKSQDGILSQDSLVKGFESVLSSLEDAVNDAPKAAEFLGRIFAKVLLENVIPYAEVWRLIYEGGEEQGRLVEIGLAAEVLGVILEIIKSDKGEPFLNNMRMGSDLRLENFRPPTIKKTSRLDKFI